MIDRKALIQSLQQRSRTTNPAGEYVPYLMEKEGGWLSDTLGAIKDAVVGETDAEKKKREDQQAADIAKQKEVLKAKGAPTTQEAPTPPSEPTTATTTAKVNDARNGGTIAVNNSEEDNLKAQKSAQDNIEKMRQAGEITTAQAVDYKDQLQKRMEANTTEQQRREGEKAVQTGLNRVATAAEFVPVLGQGVAALHAASYAAQGALADNEKDKNEAEAGMYGSIAAAALPGILKGAGKVAAVVAPKASSAVAGIAAKAGEAAAAKIGGAVGGAVETVAGGAARKALETGAKAALKSGPNPIGMAAGGLGGLEYAKEKKMGIAGTVATTLGGALGAGYLTSLGNKLPVLRYDFGASKAAAAAAEKVAGEAAGRAVAANPPQMTVITPPKGRAGPVSEPLGPDMGMQTGNQAKVTFKKTSTGQSFPEPIQPSSKVGTLKEPKVVKWESPKIPESKPAPYNPHNAGDHGEYWHGMETPKPIVHHGPPRSNPVSTGRKLGVAASTLLAPGNPALPSAAAGEARPAIVAPAEPGVGTPGFEVSAPSAPSASSAPRAPSAPAAPAASSGRMPGLPMSGSPSSSTQASTNAPSSTQASTNAPAKSPGESNKKAPGESNKVGSDSQKATAEVPNTPAKDESNIPQNVTITTPPVTPPPPPPVTPPVTPPPPPVTPPVIPPLPPVTSSTTGKNNSVESPSGDLGVQHAKLGEFENKDAGKYTKSVHRGRNAKGEGDGEDGEQFKYHRFFRVPSEIALGYRRSSEAQKAGLPESTEDSVSNVELYRRIKSAVGNYLNSKDGQELNNHLMKARKTR